MTCINKGALRGDWFGVPPLVCVELVPPMFWLDHAAVVEVLLAECRTSTSRMSPKVGCSEPSAMMERICVGGWLRVEVWGMSSSGWRR
jgi:hypothetical protein